MRTELPPGWVWARVDELCEVTLGQSPPGSSYNDIGQGSPFLQGKAEFGAIYPSIRKWTTQPKKHAAAGSVLVSVRAPVGPTNLAPVDCSIGRGLAALKPREPIAAGFVLWAMRASEKRLVEQASGSTFDAITGARLREHRIPVPPLPEQQRIVGAIEEHFSRLDAVEASVAAVQTKCAALPSIAMAQLFSPEWPTSRLDAVAQVGSGATPKRSEGKYWSHGTIPWVTSGAVNELSIWSAEEYISERALAETSVKLWPAGTVLMAMYGEGKTRGRAAVLEFESTCNQACAAINFDRSLLDGRFLRTFLNVQYEANRQLSSGGVQPNLNLGLVKAMEVPVPCLEIQASVANQAHEIVSASAELLDVCRTARQRVSALRRSILADAFAGRLVPRQSHDYSASDLMASA